MNGGIVRRTVRNRHVHEWRNGQKVLIRAPISHEWARRSLLIMDGLLADDFCVLNGLEVTADAHLGDGVHSLLQTFEHLLFLNYAGDVLLCLKGEPGGLNADVGGWVIQEL